jgi:hypothetical protein
VAKVLSDPFFFEPAGLAIGLDLRLGGGGVPWLRRARGYRGRQHQTRETPRGRTHQALVGASVRALRCHIVKVRMTMSRRLSVIAQRRRHNGSHRAMTTRGSTTIDVIEHG